MTGEKEIGWFFVVVMFFSWAIGIGTGWFAPHDKYLPAVGEEWRTFDALKFCQSNNFTNGYVDITLMNYPRYVYTHCYTVKEDKKETMDYYPWGR